jgi:thioredoxin-related protein
MATRFLLLSLGIVISSTATGSAQEIPWRTDYRTARQESRDKGLPLIVDFSTENCFWCRKLESTTFRDPVIAGILRDEFIPLRIDASRDPNLAQILRIQSYPTLVLAAPDGKILAFVEGYLEAEKLLPHLRAASATALATPDWIKRDFEAASKAVAVGDNAKAILLFRGILEEGKEGPFQRKAREHLSHLEAQAENRLAHARKMEDQGQSLEALETLAEILRSYPGTSAASEAKKLIGAAPGRLMSRENLQARRAAELLAEAKSSLKSREFCQCLERCQTLMTAYAGTPESAEAKRMVDLISENPDWLVEGCRLLSERMAAMHWTLAEAWIKKGNQAEALSALEKVGQFSPGSPLAQQARNRIAELKGAPALPTGFKKP